MAKTTLSTIADVPALIVAFLAQLVTDGWTQVGATGIYKSFEDPEGRACYIKVFEDTVGNFMVSMSPILNDAGDDFPTFSSYTNHRGCNFSSGDWDLYSTNKTFFLVRGTTNNSQRVWGGRYDFLSDVSEVVMPWTGFICGARAKDSASVRTNYLIGKSAGDLYACSNIHTIWGQSGITFFVQTDATAANVSWYPDVGFPDGLVPCHRPMLNMYGASGSESVWWGILGQIPDVIIVKKDIDLVPGDTVTVNGEKYEFREHTLYWDEYLETFLLWRMD